MIKRINIDDLKEIKIKQMYHDIFGSDSDSDFDTESNTTSNTEYFHSHEIYDKKQKKNKNTEKELEIECSVCFSIECYRIRAKRRKM